MVAWLTAQLDAPSQRFPVAVSISCQDVPVSMSKTASSAERRPFPELSQAVLGRSLSIDQVFELVMREEFAPANDAAVSMSTLWVGSIGYERYKDNRDFARRLCDEGVQRLIDVRELPISRRRGYAKTALGEAMATVGIEYVHIRALGNPKPFRDLYKAGHVAEGREHYVRYLLGEQRGALCELISLLEDKRSALMCVEHDPQTCHRTVIVEALRDEFDLRLDVAQIA
jgi:hypothetical protein